MATVVAPAEPAAAQFGCDSRQAPNPRGPTSGLSGLVAQAPDNMPEGPAFDEQGNPTSALWGRYGTAGLWWPIYDPGCNPAAEWGMRMSTGMAQWGNEATNFVLNSTAAVRSWAWRADWLGPIDDTMNTFTGGLRDSYTGPMMGLALVAAGMMIVWRGRRAQLSQTANLAGWAITMMVLGVLAMSAPTRAAEFVDTYGTGTAATVESAVAGVNTADTLPPCPTNAQVYNPDRCRLWSESPAEVSQTDPFVGLAVSEVAWHNWLVGMFGSSSSTTAREYGPRFYEAMALSWEEVSLPDDERDAVIEQKKDDFKSLAEELRDADNAAFKVLQGKTAFEDRIATAWVGALLMACITLFAAVAAVCVLLSRLVARFGIMAFPVIVPFGMVAEYRQPVMSLWKTVSGAVVTAIVYTLASGLMIRLISAMLASTMPLLLVVAIALGLTLALLVKLRAAQVIRTIGGLKIASNLSRDHIRTEEGEPARDDDHRSSSDAPPDSTGREHASAPRPPAPAPVVASTTQDGSSDHSGLARRARSNGASPGGRGQVIDARIVRAGNGRGESDGNGSSPTERARELVRPGDNSARAGRSAGVAGPADSRPSVWYMGPPGTNTGEPYYVPASHDDKRHHLQQLAPRAVFDDHVTRRDDAGRPIVDVYEPGPIDRPPARPLPPVAHPQRETS